MREIFFLTLFAALTFSACKQDDSRSKAEQDLARTQASPLILAGQWIDLDFCARSGQYGSVLKAMDNAHVPYAYAFEFLPDIPDSVICYDGTRSWKLPVKYNRDTLELQNAFEGKSVFLVYHSQGQKDMTLFDGTKGHTRVDRFIKSTANAPDGLGAFMVALHHHLFSGLMLPIGKGNRRDSLLFTPGGAIMKWSEDEYNSYRVCITNDCFTTKEPADIIIMAKADQPGSEKRFAFRYNETNDTLTLYHLLPAKEEGAAQEIGGVAYCFRRLITQ